MNNIWEENIRVKLFDFECGKIDADEIIGDIHSLLKEQREKCAKALEEDCRLNDLYISKRELNIIFNAPEPSKEK